ncbi:MAG: hypothetical protein ACKOZY_07735, partial [Flavobacteriales bacterium]
MRCALVFIFLFVSLSNWSQEHLAKVGSHEPNLPDWAQMMYGDQPNYHEVVNAYQSYFLTHPFRKTIHTQYFKRWVSSSKHRVQADGTLRAETAEERAAQTADILRMQGGVGGDRDLWHYEGPVHHVDGDGSM